MNMEERFIAKRNIIYYNNEPVITVNGTENDKIMAQIISRLLNNTKSFPGALVREKKSAGKSEKA